MIIKLYQIMVRHEGGSEHFVRIERNELTRSIGVMHVDTAVEGTLFNGDDIEGHVVRLNQFSKDEKDGDIYFQVDTPYIFNDETGEIQNETSSN